MLYGKLKVSSQEKSSAVYFPMHPEKLILVLIWRKQKGHVHNSKHKRSEREEDGDGG